MNPLTGIQTTLIALALGITFGFGSGYYTKSQFFKADQLDKVITAQSDTAKGIEQSIATNTVIEATVDMSNNKIDTIRKTVAKRIQKQEKQNDRGNEVCPSNPFFLDTGTIWLLNSARRGAATYAPAEGNATSEAPSGIGASDLIDNDLEVVKLYHELATNHDALVDYVAALIKKQGKQ